MLLQRVHVLDDSVPFILDAAIFASIMPLASVAFMVDSLRNRSTSAVDYPGGDVLGQAVA